jgi:hypothetical protein
MPYDFLPPPPHPREAAVRRRRDVRDEHLAWIIRGGVLRGVQCIDLANQPRTGYHRRGWQEVFARGGIAMERAWMRRGWKLVAACTIAVTAGCGQQGPDSGAAPKERPTASISSRQRSGAPVERQGKEASATRPAARPIESPPPPPAIAPVAMTAKQLRTCLVKVGNPLPDDELPLADGKAVPVRSLLGKRGTVGKRRDKPVWSSG